MRGQCVGQHAADRRLCGTGLLLVVQGRLDLLRGGTSRTVAGSSVSARSRIRKRPQCVSVPAKFADAAMAGIRTVTLRMRTW